MQVRLPSGSICRALVADDDDDARALMAASLRRAGFEVHELCNGKELVATFALQRGARTLVVSDIGMPELDGIAATNLLRRQSNSPPILLVTAFGDVTTLRDAKAAGADRVLLKPLDISKFVETAVELARAAF